MTVRNYFSALRDTNNCIKVGRARENPLAINQSIAECLSLSRKEFIMECFYLSYKLFLTRLCKRLFIKSFSRTILSCHLLTDIYNNSYYDGL